MKKFLTSRNVFFALCFLFVLNRFWSGWGPAYNNGEMIKWDSYGYYLYLPSIFIYDDPGFKDMSWVDTLQHRYNPTATLYQLRDGHEGMKSIKYPCGSAILWSPFFFTAHLLAEPLGYPADGLSPPYSWAILLGGCIYAFIGLWFLRKVLLRFFNDPVAAVVMILITMGTNYWSMAASETVMPHGNSFALNCVLLWLVIRWHEQPSFGRSFAMGLTLGIGVLVRPTEIFWILVPLFWNVSSWKTLITKFRFLWEQRMKLLVFIAVFSAVIFIQLSYWKYSLGVWVSYGYEERFAIWKPFLYECMFTFKKGWFVYTPLMIFCFAGFYFLWKRKREVFWSIALLTVLHTWVIFSWECWWYAACFSQRGAIDMYAALTIPLGFLIVATWEKAVWVKITVASLLGFCLVLSVFQTWQYNHGIIHTERMSEAYYWRVFGKTAVTAEDLNFLEVDHWPQPRVMPENAGLVCVDDYLYTFESDSSFTHESIVDSIAYRGTRSYLIRPPAEFGVKREVNFYGGTNEYQWVRASVWMRMDTALKPGMIPPMLCVSYDAGGRSLKWEATAFDSIGYVPGEWQKVVCEVMSPISLYRDDKWIVQIWHPSKTAVYMDDFRIEVFEPAGQSLK